MLYNTPKKCYVTNVDGQEAYKNADFVLQYVEEWERYNLLYDAYPSVVKRSLWRQNATAMCGLLFFDPPERDNLPAKDYTYHEQFDAWYSSPDKIGQTCACSTHKCPRFDEEQMWRAVLPQMLKYKYAKYVVSYLVLIYLTYIGHPEYDTVLLELGDIRSRRKFYQALKQREADKGWDLGLSQKY